MQHDPVRLEDTRAWLIKAEKDLIDQAVPLTEYAWKFRYPCELYEPTDDEAQQALQIANELYDAVVARLPAEVRP